MTETTSSGVEIPGTLVSETAGTGPVSEPALRDPSEASSPEASATPPEGASVSGETAEKTPKKKASPRGAAMAAAGSAIGAIPPPEPTPQWPAPRTPDETFVPEEFDFTDLMEVNRMMNACRARLFRVSQSQKLAQRTLAQAQSDYDRAMRRELVTISGGTAETRRAMAEIRCEHLENRVIVGKQVVEEWRKRSTDVRDDLKAIENIAHNVRAQIDVR